MTAQVWAPARWVRLREVRAEPPPRSPPRPSAPRPAEGFCPAGSAGRGEGPSAEEGRFPGQEVRPAGEGPGQPAGPARAWGRAGRAGAGSGARGTVAFMGTFSSKVGQRRRQHGPQRGRQSLRDRGRVRRMGTGRGGAPRWGPAGGDWGGSGGAAAAWREGAWAFQALRDRLANSGVHLGSPPEKMGFPDRFALLGSEGSEGGECGTQALVEASPGSLVTH